MANRGEQKTHEMVELSSRELEQVQGGLDALESAPNGTHEAYLTYRLKYVVVTSYQF